MKLDTNKKEEISEELKEQIRDEYCEPGRWDKMKIERLALAHDLRPKDGSLLRFCWRISPAL